jgi:antitoxin component of RelBE/YafQ-DinJ toxin-antitoxin module
MNQTAELKVRITPELKALAKIQAKRCGMKMSEYIRDLIESDISWKDITTITYEVHK